MQKISNINKGIALAFLTSIISGVAIFYSKISLTKIPPLTLATSRNLYVGILFIVLILLTGKLKEIKKLNRKQFIILILIGVIGGALPFYLFFTGLQFTNAITANLIHKSLFIWVSVSAFMFLKEKFSVTYLVSFALIFLGNFYFAKLPVHLGNGELMILAATLLWSIENVVAKKILKTVSSELVGLFRMGIGGGLLVIATLLTGRGSLLLTLDLGKLSVILIGGTILFFYVFAWYKALKYAPASLVTLILTFSVVVGNILNGSFAGVKLVQKDIYSSILVAGAVFFILLQTTGIPKLFRNLLNRFPPSRE